MGKSARTRGRRQREADEKAVAEQAQREALEEAGYPVEALQRRFKEQGKVRLEIDGMTEWPGKIARIEVAAGPRVFVVIELEPPGLP